MARVRQLDLERVDGEDVSAEVVIRTAEEEVVALGVKQTNKGAEYHPRAIHDRPVAVLESSGLPTQKTRTIGPFDPRTHMSDSSPGQFPKG